MSTPFCFTTFQFQSTRPIRGATDGFPGCIPRGLNFNPRAPYGARPTSTSRPTTRMYFNPRAPYGARLQDNKALMAAQPISIHAPHTGRDREYHHSREPRKRFQSTRPIRGATDAGREGLPRPNDFNPRAPYGARLIKHASYDGGEDFNPRAPYGARLAVVIDIHLAIANFNPRAPYGARRFRWSYLFRVSLLFQSTRPIRGAT